jgi:hypothetical protein
LAVIVPGVVAVFDSFALRSRDEEAGQSSAPPRSSVLLLANEEVRPGTMPVLKKSFACPKPFSKASPKSPPALATVGNALGPPFRDASGSSKGRIAFLCRYSVSTLHNEPLIAREKATVVTEHLAKAYPILLH